MHFLCHLDAFRLISAYLESFRWCRSISFHFRSFRLILKHFGSLRYDFTWFQIISLHFICVHFGRFRSIPFHFRFFFRSRHFTSFHVGVLRHILAQIGPFRFIFFFLFRIHCVISNCWLQLFRIILIVSGYLFYFDSLRFTYHVG